MGASILVFVLSFINNKVIYVFLSKADNGFFRLFQQSVFFLALFAGDWLRLSNLNIAGEKKENIPLLSGNGLWFGVAIFSSLSLSVLAFRSFFDRLFFGFSWAQLILLIFTGSLFIVRNNLQSLLLVNHRMKSYSFTFIIWIIIFAGMDVFFQIKDSLTMGGVLYAFTCATLGCTIWAFFASAKLNGHSFKLSPALFVRSSKIGLRAWIAVVGMFVMIQMNMFIIKPFSGNEILGLEMVAVYSICYNFFMLFQHGADVAGTVLFSHVVQQDKQKSANLTAQVSRNTILISLVLVTLGALTAKFLILLIADSRYLSAYVPLLIIMPGIIAINAGSVLNGFFWGRGYPFKIILVPYIATAVGVIMNIILIPRYGVCGASFTFSFTALGWFILLIFDFAKENGLRIYDVIVPNHADINLIVSKTYAFYKRLVN